MTDVSRPHPDPEVGDPDGVFGGRDRDRDAGFSTDDGLPGDAADQTGYGEEGGAFSSFLVYFGRWPSISRVFGVCAGVS